MATVTRYTALITTVDPTSSKVGFVTKADAQERQATVLTTPIASRWPMEGETWLVRQENGSWYIDQPLPGNNSYQSVATGDAVINSPTGNVHVLGSGDGSTDFGFAKGNIPPVPPHSSGQVLQTTGTGGSFWGGVSAGGGSVLVARAYRNAAFTPTSGWNKIPVDTVSYDPGGIVSTANGRITVPVAGYYIVAGEVDFGATASGQDSLASIYKNGTEVSRGTRNYPLTNGALVGHSVSDVVYCNASDYLELWAYVGGSTNIATGNSQLTRFSVTAVSSLPGVTGTTTVARAYRNAALTQPGGLNAIPVDTKTHDPGNCINTSTGVYACPATGYYQVNGSVNVSAPAGFLMSASILRNAGQVAEGTTIYDSTTGQSQGAAVSDVIQCNAGDTISLAAYFSTSQALRIGPQWNYLSVVQVGTSMNFTSAGGDLSGSYPNPTIAVATWNYVGQSGQPTFSNGWVNYGTNPTGADAGGQIAVRFRKMLNRVEIGGICKSGTVGGNAAIFTLPTGYRPIGYVRFAGESNGAAYAFEVSAGGAVYLVTGSNVWADLTCAFPID